ncbi:MAG TPA: hypothetical protein VGO47_00225, partial [Chlamydiales bacterium]|nr:hypothetical protein [Chlamydiales bacterium]
MNLLGTLKVNDAFSCVPTLPDSPFVRSLQTLELAATHASGGLNVKELIPIKVCRTFEGSGGSALGCEVCVARLALVEAAADDEGEILSLESGTVLERMDVGTSTEAGMDAERLGGGGGG